MYRVYLQLQNGGRWLLAEFVALEEALVFAERFSLLVPGALRIEIQHVPVGAQAA
ncbi:MAG: hypothetical protein N2561_00950 [Bacteroidetes bacterium]|nr:hypothetical protein [Rhodothermia bacterium]MCS7155806.1 hypothetical protein [Bacteroidota bacterium]MCX7906093.1 hypothetical protein [Bacteroidota bacterium]MDW8138221.1 hypothetical protein [Bacteroidota bacterium]MDW8285905.1 hypothetical protein [Bacteroidota bacterium]